jgi:hypothetical protein
MGTLGAEEFNLIVMIYYESLTTESYEKAGYYRILMSVNGELIVGLAVSNS